MKGRHRELTIAQALDTVTLVSSRIRKDSLIRVNRDALIPGELSAVVPALRAIHPPSMFQFKRNTDPDSGRAGWLDVLDDDGNFLCAVQDYDTNHIALMMLDKAVRARFAQLEERIAKLESR